MTFDKQFPDDMIAEIYYEQKLNQICLDLREVFHDFDAARKDPDIAEIIKLNQKMAMDVFTRLNDALQTTYIAMHQARAITSAIDSVQIKRKIDRALAKDKTT
mgnify:CR=1 FL=1